MRGAEGSAPEYADQALSWLIASFLVVFCTTIFVALSPQLWHWFLIPTALCGIVLGTDLVGWARGHLDVLEPRALVALFGFHMVFAVPLLHVAWDFWPQYVAPATDWRHSMGVLGLVNLVGLAIYRHIVGRPMRERPPRFEVDRALLLTWAPWAILVSIAASAVIVMRSGGPLGYLSAIADPDGRETLSGSGWLLVVGESWPLLLFVVILLRRRDWYRTHPGAATLLLFAFAITQFAVGGLRGDRSNTIWPLLMALGIVSLLVVQVRRSVLVAGIVTGTLFIWLYGFYKATGTDALGIVTGSSSTSALSRETGRSMQRVVLEDLGRGGIQAVVVDRFLNGTAGPPARGGTYLGALDAVVLPQGLETGAADKRVAGKRVQFGNYGAGGEFQASRIYGLTGEGIINLGLFGAPLAFVPFALWVRYCTRIYRVARRGSLAAGLVAPCLAVSCVLAFGSDFDNWLWFLIKHALPLLALIWVSRAVLSNKGGGTDG